MTTTPTTKLRRDAAASVFVYGLAGLALAVHAVRTITHDWPGGLASIDVSDPDGRSTTALVATEPAPGWAVTTLRAAQVAEWVLGAAVLALLTLCVVRMIRGEVFARSTARTAGWASWTLLAFIVLPSVLRLAASGELLHAAGVDEGFDVRPVGSEFWYLYVGMMTLSFLALVLRRGSQLREDQEGLI